MSLAIDRSDPLAYTTGPIASTRPIGIIILHVVVGPVRHFGLLLFISLNLILLLTSFVAATNKE